MSRLLRRVSSYADIYRGPSDKFLRRYLWVNITKHISFSPDTYWCWSSISRRVIRRMVKLMVCRHVTVVVILKEKKVLSVSTIFALFSATPSAIPNSALMAS